MQQQPTTLNRGLGGTAKARATPTPQPQQLDQRQELETIVPVDAGQP